MWQKRFGVATLNRCCWRPKLIGFRRVSGSRIKCEYNSFISMMLAQHWTWQNCLISASWFVHKYCSKCCFCQCFPNVICMGCCQIKSQVSKCGNFNTLGLLWV
jgi:hypothetical protein